MLDLLHASSYLWQAASLFHPPGSPQTLPRVKQQLGLILHGKVNTVIDALRRQGTVLSAHRQQALEGICDSFNGVAKAYAIQAGREVRVIVQPERVTDLEAIALSREIKRKIEGSTGK